MKKEHFKHQSALQLLIEFLIFFTLLAVQTGLSYSAPYSRSSLHRPFDLTRFQPNLFPAGGPFRFLHSQSKAKIVFPFRDSGTQHDR